MGAVKDLAISLDALGTRDWADVFAALRAGGIDPAAVDFTDVAGMPTLALAALIHVTKRRDNPHATYRNSFRLAALARAVPHGG